MARKNSNRFERTILATCCLPWRDPLRLDEDLFRSTIRALVTKGFRDLYVFGTAGEGQSVNEKTFQQVVRAFTEELLALGAEPMVCVIGTSLATSLERI